MPHKLRIERHQILQRHGAQYAPLAAERHALLGLDGGVQAGGPSAVLRDAAFELVHGFDGGVLHHVVHVAVEQEMGVDGVVHRAVQRQVRLREEVAASQGALENLDAFVGQRDIPAELIEREMRAAMEAAHDGVHAAGQHLLVHGAAGQHQRDARFVDENGVGLVDHCCPKGR